MNIPELKIEVTGTNQHNESEYIVVLENNYIEKNDVVCVDKREHTSGHERKRYYTATWSLKNCLVAVVDTDILRGAPFKLDWIGRGMAACGVQGKKAFVLTGKGEKHQITLPSYPQHSTEKDCLVMKEGCQAEYADWYQKKYCNK